MPIVDLQTGKIYGCEKYSYSWWHEKGHLEFNNHDKGVLYNYRKELFLKMCILLLIANSIYECIPFKFILVALGTLSLYYYFYEELWCWKYALEFKKKKKNKVKWDKKGKFGNTKVKIKSIKKSNGSIQ